MHKIFFGLLFLLVSTSSHGNFNFYKDLSLRPIDLDSFGEALTKNIFNSKGWPEKLEYKRKNYVLSYSFNEELTDYIKKRLRYYRSDYASVVVIDNNTGRILSAIDYNREKKEFGRNLTFSSTNPAASVFKVITAAELIENSEVEKESMFSYRGKATTLYKYQLKDKKTRWTRQIPFGKAFAFSNNVVFGKAAINNTDRKGLITMANKFGFNKDIFQVINVGSSKLFNKEGDFALAELASGFNRKTMISPVHGAVIASVIANDGVLISPTILDSIKTEKHDRLIWSSSFEANRVLTRESSNEMQELMELTVKGGTARSPFRPWKTKKVVKELKVGGKTGTITGGVPYGKRDWFVSYAMPKEGDDKGISVCVMIVNLEKWYVKSTVLAKEVIQHYYSRIANENG